MTWEGFLKSLETDGGKLVILISGIAFLSFVAMLMTATGHPLHEPAKVVFIGAISQLLGMTYPYLTKKEKAP